MKQLLKDDPQLRALLQRWQTAEPSADFNVAVWKQIHADAAGQPQRSAGFTLRAWFALHPAWLGSMAAAAGIVVGAGLALPGGGIHGIHPAGQPLLHGQTLTGSYVAMVTGGAR